MKRHGNLFPEIVTFDNLHAAYVKAARGKRYTHGALKFTERLEENLIQLQNELMWGQWRPRPTRRFTIFEPKERIIHAAAFRDRVVHHAVMNVLEPIWDGLFIEDSFACRAGKGTHAGVIRLERMLQSAEARWGRVYCLKADVSKFFPSINHAALAAIAGRKIKCRRTLAIIEAVIYAEGDRADPDSRGMPIGNLLSQWMANLYLNELDHLAKHDLKARYYLRYMDDFIILHGDKAELWRMRREIETFLAERLALTLNRKTGIFPVSQGIDFLGYRIWRDHRLLRKSSSRRMLKTLRRFQTLYALGRVPYARIQASIMSWLGHCRHCNSHRVRARVMRAARFTCSGPTLVPDDIC